MILIEHLNDAGFIVEIFFIAYLLYFKVVIQVIINTHLFFAGDIKLAHNAGAGDTYILFQLFINLANHVFENIFLCKNKVDIEYRDKCDVSAEEACLL